MHRRLLALLFALALPTTVAAADLEYYIANAGGTVTVGRDGTVVDVELADADADALGSEVMQHYEDHIRAWHFEPVLEDGQPIQVRAHMRLSLVAMREKGHEEITLGIRNVLFVDPPKTGDSAAVGPSSTLRPPTFPSRVGEAGAGAEVLLLVELGEGGAVTHVGTQHILMLGSDQGRHARTMANLMAKAAESAAADWRIAGYPAGQKVSVPVVFNTVRGGGWQRMYPFEAEPDPWVLAALAQHDVTRLAAGGERPSRLQLVSELQGLPGLGAAD